MADPVRLTVGDVVLTRVEYFDIALDPGAVGLAAEQIEAQSWAVPAWATDGGQVLVGQAMWVATAGGTTIVVDPCGASDAFLRSGPDAITHQDAMLAALAAAGFDRDGIDIVLMSHLDGIGLIGVVDEDGTWAPAFPGARVVATRTHLDFLASDAAEGVAGLEAFAALRALGVVDGVADGHEVAPGVVLEITDAHVPGHAVVRIGDGTDGDRAVLVGHLAVSPLHAATGPCTDLHNEPDAAWAALGSLVAEAADEGTLLIGPLWPAPGVATVEQVDGRVTLVPART